MVSSTTVPVGPHTWEQFLELPDLPDGRRAVALIDGEVVWMPPPAIGLEAIISNALFSLRAWTGPGVAGGYAITRPLVRIEGRLLGYVADLGWYAPADVTLDDDGVPVPLGLVSLAVEVWSPSNWMSEITRKERDYAKAGVAEFWGISRHHRGLTRWWDPVDGTYQSMHDVPEGQVLTTPLLPGFALEVGGLFRA